MKKILDHGYVTLIESWGSDERVVEAARMSTGKGFLGWNDVPCHKATDSSRMCAAGTAGCNVQHGNDNKLLASLYRDKHATPFEMGGMVIEVAAPIFVFREWHRHRTQSYNEMSARYVPLPNVSYLPDPANAVQRSEFAAASRNKQQQGVGGKVLSREDALSDLDALAQLYDDIEAQYQRMLAHGWPKELARCPLPVARYSRMRASVNLRNWLGFLTLRMAPDAQWEIRQYAIAVGELIADAFPRTWALFEEELS